MLHEKLFHKIIYTWRNSDFFNTIVPKLPLARVCARGALEEMDDPERAFQEIG
jgi:hypothetical protein